MGITDLTCSCGYPAAEFRSGLYRCLNPRCGHEFKVEEDRNAVNPNAGQADKDLTFICSVCGGTFHVQNKSYYPCSVCQRPICEICYAQTRTCPACEQAAEKILPRRLTGNQIILWLVLSAIILYVFARLGYLTMPNF